MTENLAPARGCVEGILLWGVVILMPIDVAEGVVSNVESGKGTIGG